MRILRAHSSLIVKRFILTKKSPYASNMNATKYDTKMNQMMACFHEEAVFNSDMASYPNTQTKSLPEPPLCVRTINWPSQGPLMEGEPSVENMAHPHSISQTTPLLPKPN